MTAALPGTTILNLPLATALSGTESFPMVQGGVTKRATTSLIPGFAPSTIAANTVLGNNTGGILGGPVAINLVTNNLAMVGGALGLSTNILILGTLGVVGPLHVGNSAILNSIDAQIWISRTVDNTVAGNGHAFSDSSTVDRSGNIAYNSYDGRLTVGGSQNYQHFATFQNAPTISTSGTVSIHYGLVSLPIVGAGTVTNVYHNYAGNVTGAGAVTNQYGFYCEALTKGGTLNYAYFSAGTAPSVFGGDVDAASFSVGGVSVTGAWPHTTPSVSALGVPGTFAATCDLYTLVNGKKIEIRGKIVLSDMGTATYFGVTLPVTANSANSRGVLLHGTSLSDVPFAFSGLGSQTASYALSAAGTAVTTPGTYYFEGTYEAA